MKYLLAVFLVACMPPVEGEEIPPPANLPAAVDAGHSIWSDLMPYGLPDVNLDFYWIDTECIEWEGDYCVMGRFIDRPWWERGRIYLAARNRIADTPLMHELMHYYLWHLFADEDPGHKTDWWDMVSGAADQLRAWEDDVYGP